MADCCCTPSPLNLDPHRGSSTYRRVLWTVLAINGVMFLVEIGAGVAAGSASLQADALDFFGDAANYAISLMVVGMAYDIGPPQHWLKARQWAYSVSGLSEPFSGTRYMARFQVPSRWGLSALPR